jgi:Zn-dependent protease with chaperone function
MTYPSASPKGARTRRPFWSKEPPLSRCRAAGAALSLALVLPAVATAQAIVLYEHIDFTGKSTTITSPTASLDQLWNDKTSSIKIGGGSWEVCRHNDFVDCRVFDADATDLRTIGWNDAVSSLRPVSIAAPAYPGSDATSAAAPSSAVASSAPTGGKTSAAAFAGKPAVVKGYLEYRKGDAMIVEGQRLVATKATKFHGAGEGKSFSGVPLGYMVEASGVRRADGAIEVARVDAKPNGQQMYESDVKQATDQLEATWRSQGAMLTAAPDGGVASMGKMHESGREYDRARGIVDRVLPSYIPRDAVRVYVVDNPEWNAMAMGNYSIYVFTGIMTDLDDDELALVIGHEVAHASHEHSRKQAKRGMLTGLAATASQVLIGTQLEGSEAYAASILAGLGATAFSNGYSREQEDQADRVGMRYAYEGGYDVSKGPALWKKFADKYGEAGKAQNILFGDHSRSTVRAAALQQEIALNYAAQ